MRRILVAGGLVAAAVGVNVVAALGTGAPGTTESAAAVLPVPATPVVTTPPASVDAATTAPQALPRDVPTARPTAPMRSAAKGPARLVSRVTTKDPVVFITLDDGLVTDPALVKFLTRRQLPVTTFLTTSAAESSWPYWRAMLGLGSVQNHTVVHPTLTRLGTTGASREVCAANRRIAQRVGERPWMLRPPYGRYDASTLAAAGNCGLDYVVMWSVSLPGKHLRYQVGDRLRPGDIILSHYRTDLIPALRRALRDIEAQGLRVARLEDYLTPRR